MTGVQTCALPISGTTFTATQSGVDVTYIDTIPQIEIYSGYDTGEGYEAELPLTLIGTFTPVYDVNGEISFDISGYIKSIFTIVPPVEGINFSLFNRFRLKFDGTLQEYYMAVNSSIATDILNDIYVGTGIYLSSATTQIIFDCGKTVLTTLEATGVVINIIVDDAGMEGDYLDSDYLDTDYLTEFI